MKAYIDRFCSAFSTRSAKQDALLFGGVQAQSISADFINDRFITLSVGLSRDDYSIVLGALTEKFGAPTLVERPEFKTQGGLTTTNEVCTWRIGAGKVIAKRYAFSIDRSSVSYSDDIGSAEMERRFKEAGKAGAKSL